MDDGREDKKAKGTKKCVIVVQFSNAIILKSHQGFKSNYHNVYNEQTNKIALSRDDDKRLQTFDKTTTHPLGTNTFKVCESKMLSKYKLLILMIMQMKTKQNII